MLTTLVVGFDSAWSGNNSGAIVGVLKHDNGSYEPLGDPQPVKFVDATKQIKKWQDDHCITSTLILIDQPIIVENEIGQRPVENIVGSPVGKRNGGVQPANRGKHDMFGNGAPIWQFLLNHNAFLDPSKFIRSQYATWVIETYPVLTLIAMGWLRPSGQLPKYNPDRKTFSHKDWELVCKSASKAFKSIGLSHIAEWIDAAKLPATRDGRKQLQDCLDACICLLVGLQLIEGNEALFVGDMRTGYMVVPYENKLYQELENRCKKTKREPSDWLCNFKIH